MKNGSQNQSNDVHKEDALPIAVGSCTLKYTLPPLSHAISSRYSTFSSCSKHTMMSYQTRNNDLLEILSSCVHNFIHLELLMDEKQFSKSTTTKVGDPTKYIRFLPIFSVSL